MDSYLQIKETETIGLLCELIQIKSMSKDEGSLCEFLKKRLEACQMTVCKDQHGNLYGQYGSGSPVVLFNTHLDNVPVGGGWKSDPFVPTIKDGVLYGRGACDPKGALAAMIIAMETVIEAGRAAGQMPKGTILFMGAVSEEVSPPSEKGTWKAVKDGLVHADMAICGEPTGNLPCIGEFGKMEYELVVRGKAAHASAPEQGINAILLLSELLLALDQRVERRYSALLGRKGTFNVGTVSGGVQVNVIPELAVAALERRLVPGQTGEESMSELCRICDEVKAIHPALDYELRVTGEGNPALISEQETVVSVLQGSIEQIVGERPKPRGFVAHADADWLITYGNIPTVIFGPGALADAHTDHEKVELSQVVQAAKVLALFLEQILY